MDMKHITAFKVVEKHPDGSPMYMYSRSKMTGMSERESFTRFDKIVVSPGKHLYVSGSFDHPDYPETK